jgi:hypothetical protein
MRLTTKIVNDELARLAIAHAWKASGYFYLLGGEATAGSAAPSGAANQQPQRLETVDRRIPAVEGPESADSSKRSAWAEGGASGRAQDGKDVVTVCEFS